MTHFGVTGECEPFEDELVHSGWKPTATIRCGCCNGGVPIWISQSRCLNDSLDAAPPERGLNTGAAFQRMPWR